MIMTFGELAGRIEHDIPKGEKDVIKKLADGLEQFIVYCEVAKQGEIKNILSDLLQIFKTTPAQNLHTEDVHALVEALNIKVHQAGLKNAEPTFLFLAVDIYKSKLPGVPQVALYLEGYKMLTELLITVLNKVNPSYNLYKLYDPIFLVNNILDDHQTIIICGNAFAERLKVHGYPDSRIVCLDFSIRSEQSFLKSIRLPCKITEFKEILSLQCGL
jgi:hypothetical protein